MIVAGFTGRSTPVPPIQARSLWLVMETLGADEGHHGDCVGADAVFDRVCVDQGITRHAHPGLSKPGKSNKRAYCGAEHVHLPLPYLERNRVIVASCTVLIACPAGPERLRSGTWATVRYAREAGKPIIMVWPNGWVEP
jgi:hypothetical protein